MRWWQYIRKRWIAPKNRKQSWGTRVGCIDGESGNVMLLVVLSMVVLFGFAALVIDVGVLYEEKQRLQNGADAGALAGADVLLSDPTGAANTAYQLAASNNQSASYQASSDTGANTVTVTGKETVPLWFARVLGYSSSTIHATSTAELGTLTSDTYMVPIAVLQQPLQYGETVDLSQSAGTGSSGNYAFVNFGSSTGANDLEQYIATGYPGTFSVGELISTKTGMNVGPVRQAIDYRMQANTSAACNSFSTAGSDCPRVMILPLVNTLDVNGTKDVQIVGFGAFYLDGLVNSGGQQQIVGQFKQLVVPGTIGNGTDDGTYSVKLAN